jgi:hypothetical protein
VHLESFSVSGFRSLAEVMDIPISSPTIVTGHNDGGKTALLEALAFLLDEYKVEERDRTYLADGSQGRCAEVEVEGWFRLGTWEQERFHLPDHVRIRRVAGQDRTGWEYLVAVPADPEFRDLDALKLPDLRRVSEKYKLAPVAPRNKPEYLAVLREHAFATSDHEDWVPLPGDVRGRLPRLLCFNGRTPAPEKAVEAALKSRFAEHISDEGLVGQVKAIENEVKERLRIDSKSLRDHIKQRCPDIAEVDIEPDVSFQQGLRGANLHLVRGKNGPVDLGRTGLGSRRRIALAIWEWVMELQAGDIASAGTIDPDGEPAPPVVQTIVVYDEPDTHLDYEHQRKVMDLIREQSAVPSVNVVVATHSMNLIDGVDIADVVNLKLVEGCTEVERLGVEEHEAIDRFYGKVAASLGVRNSVLLHERCFVAVEGPSEQQAFPLLFRLSEQVSLQAAGLALWACGNNDGALHLAGYLASRGRRVQLVIDADSQRQKMFGAASLTRHFGDRTNEIVRFIGDPAGPPEFEAVFPDELWARVANACWPRLEGEWSPQDFADHRAGKFSSAVEEMLKTGSERGPHGKPDMMHTLALSLRDRDGVPEELRTIFRRLRELAAE